MMYPRSQLLKELLREDGAIFVSIDDNEAHHLRMMMEDVFGEENFVATIIWRNSTGPKQSNQLSTSHDYIYPCPLSLAPQWFE
jgi:adenine-specific DNA-methyltransferase